MYIEKQLYKSNNHTHHLCLHLIVKLFQINSFSCFVIYIIINSGYHVTNEDKNDNFSHPNES